MQAEMTLLSSLRPSFLLLTPACLTLGLGCAWLSADTLSANLISLMLGASLLAHISVNLLNEYVDFRSGLDQMAQRTSFSGGSGFLPAHPERARDVRNLGVIALVLTAMIGLFLVIVTGWDLLPLGLVGLLVVITYSSWIVRHPWICLIAPGLGFGPLLVMGSARVLSGGYDFTTVTASMIPFFLVNNLLLLNQFPDLDADRAAGRDNIPLRYGTGFAAHLFSLQMLLAYIVLTIAVLTKTLPASALTGLLTAPVAIWCVWRVQRQHHNLPALMPALAANVLVNLATPTLIGLSLIIHVWSSG